MVICYIMATNTDELFYQAAGILRKVREKKGTVKTLVYASGFKNLRQLFALVSECVKNKIILGNIASGCPKAFHCEAAIQGDFEVAIVLLYEYLLGRKFGKAVGFRRYKADIKSAVDKVLLDHGVKTLKEACQISGKELVPKIPRYMRVNLIKSSVESAIQQLQAEEWQFVGMFRQEEFSTKALALSQWQFGLDPMLPDVLVFPPHTDLHDHRLTRSGVLVQQDRASCIPARVLNPRPGSTVLDSCAAPGNKTSHLASLLKDHGRVIALDRDFKRLGTMTRLLSKSGATCVELIHQDFLTVEPSSADAEDVQFILVDPSCSGSGMLNNQTNDASSDVNPSRIQTLKRFQISILKHALRFPNVQRVVYSTCSVHQQENEEVAEEVMSQVTEQFQFTKIFSSWEGSRGLEHFPHSEFFLRLSPVQDLTQGFFVACFDRIERGITQAAEDAKVTDNQLTQRNQTSYHENKKKRKREKNVHSVVNGEKKFLCAQKKKEPVSVDSDYSEDHTEADKSVVTKRNKKKRKYESLGKVQNSELVSLSVQGKKEKMCAKNLDNDSS